MEKKKMKNLILTDVPVIDENSRFYNITNRDEFYQQLQTKIQALISDNRCFGEICGEDDLTNSISLQLVNVAFQCIGSKIVEDKFLISVQIFNTIHESFWDGFDFSKLKINLCCTGILDKDNNITDMEFIKFYVLGK